MSAVLFPSLFITNALEASLFQLRGCEVPVYELVEEDLHKVFAGVAVVDVVRVLPDVARDQRDKIARDRSVRVGCFHDLKRVAILNKPCPAAAEL